MGLILKKAMKPAFAGMALLLAVVPLWAAPYTITVDAGQRIGTWDRFYEKLISTDHMVTMLHSSYGRNMQNALRRAATECGFRYFRGHGILNSDIGLYSEPGGVPTYEWSKFDSVYDIALALGMRPIVEFSFTPVAMASGFTTCLWYNGAPGNITMPKDLNKWRDLCKTVVLHCESRWGVDEVRNWYFEVYNEPDLGTFFVGTQQDYFKLYDYASEGVRQADSLCRVGGPATSASNPTWIDAFLKHVMNGTNAATGQKGVKCDFVTYHRYADDPGYSGGTSNPVSQSEYHKQIVDYCSANQFKGLIINNEWGPCAMPTNSRDNESCASFVVKTVHLLAGNGAQYPPPFMYGYWCISDIYEEMNYWTSGRRTAYTGGTGGNYGLMLMGDAAIPESYDVAKPVFNAFKLLHKMGDIQISTTGGSATGPNSFATINADSSAIQVMVYDHTTNDNVSLKVANIPFAGPVRVEHYVVDSGRSNSYRAWLGMQSPKVPTAAQWAQLKAAAELAMLDTVRLMPLASDNSFSKTFDTKKFSVHLIMISDPSRIAVRYGKATAAGTERLQAHIMNSQLYVSLPKSGLYHVSLLRADGARVLSETNFFRKRVTMPVSQVRPGTYLLTCSNGSRSWVTKLVLCR